MKIVQYNVAYYPYSVYKLDRINNEDLKNDGILVLPSSVEVVDSKAMPFNIKPREVIIPNSDILINSHRLKRSNATFILKRGKEIESLFHGVKAQSIILPDGLKEINSPGFSDSIIGKLNIPSTVEKCSPMVFNNSQIKHLIINRNLLEQISSQFLTKIKKDMKLTITDDSDNVIDLNILPLSKDELDSLNFIDKVLDFYLNILNSWEQEVRNREIGELKGFLVAYRSNLIKEINRRLNIHKGKDVSINDIIHSDKRVSINLPSIKTDGYSITMDGKMVKVLSLDDVLKYRKLI